MYSPFKVYFEILILHKTLNLNIVVNIQLVVKFMNIVQNFTLEYNRDHSNNRYISRHCIRTFILKINITIVQFNNSIR